MSKLKRFSQIPILFPALAVIGSLVGFGIVAVAAEDLPAKVSAEDAAHYDADLANLKLIDSEEKRLQKEIAEARERYGTDLQRIAKLYKFDWATDPVDVKTGEIHRAKKEPKQEPKPPKK